MQHPEAFPCLTELHLAFRMKESDNDLDVHGLDEIIRNFLILREGNISRLTIPAFLENNMTESLKKDIPYIEVCDLISSNTISLILLQIYQDQN